MIHNLREREHNDKLKLRVAVDSSGCSGYKYAFDLDDKINEDDVYV